MSSKKFNFSPTLFLTILLILILPNNIIAEDFQQSQTWYGNIIRELEQREYYITNSIDDNMYQSPNRAQNLRFKYYSNGFMAQPRSTKIAQFDLNDHSILDSDKTYRYIQDWQINLTLAGYGEESDLKEFSGTDLIVDENYASIEDDHMIIEYLNNEKGMRQNFILKEKLKGNDHLGLIINIETNLVMAISDQAISFSDQNGEEKLRYSSLKVWDVNNLPLEANFEKISSNTFAIIVHDEQAAYPITIDPLSTSADWSKAGGQASANFGFSVATAGDVNGDGYSDIIVGAPYYDNGYSDHGVVFGYYGSESGPSTTHDWLVGTNQKTDAHFGFSVSTAGDINGDGYSDVIIGAPGCENGQTDEGIVYIYHGSESGLTSYSTYQREVNQASAQFGFSVSTAGDVNGDGYSDIIASALYYDGGQTDEGKVFVYHGSPSGLSSTPDWDQELNQAYAQYGFAVSTAGDVNGDGYSDVIVGAPYYDNAQVDEGQVFAYYGSSGGLASDWSWYKRSNTANARFGFSVSTAGDANGDGYSDVLVGTPYWNNGMAAMYMGTSGGIYDVPIWGPSEGTTWIRFGYSLACAGDINGDGYSDVIVGAPEYSDGQTYEGRAYVYYGNSSGASSTADWTVESDQANAYLGQCVATAGDVNGDGFSDVIVGAPNYDDTQTDEGKAYLYFGAIDTFITTSDEDNAISFDGISSYIHIPHPDQLTAYTFEMWVKPEAIRLQSIFVRTGNDGPLSSFSHNLYMTTEGKFAHYTFDQGTATGLNVVGTTTAEVGIWYHVAITAENNGVIRLFVNGIEEGTPASIVSIWTGGVYYHIGDNRGGGLACFDGIVDEVKVWNVAHTQSEIQANYASLLGNVPGLIAYWPMDTGSGTTLVDVTGRGYDGILCYSPTWVSSTAPVGAPVFSVLSHNFGNVVIGKTEQDSVTISNTGGGILHIYNAVPNSGQITIDPTSANITSLSSQVFTATFSPISEGAFSSSIDFSDNASNNSLTVSGFGIKATHHVGSGQTYALISSALANSLSGDTIIVHNDITEHDISIDIGINIIGDGVNRVSVNASHEGRIFYINTSDFVYIENLNINSGYHTNDNVDGAGIYVCDSTVLSMENCIIQYNYLVGANGRGGGLYIDSTSTLSMTDCNITNNRAEGNHGGGIFSAGTLEMLGCTIDGNTANDDGGGLYIDSASTFSMTDCNITNNRTEGNNGSGIFSAGTLELLRCIITNNAGANRGGGFYIDSASTLSMTDCNITNNIASNENGGGIYAHGTLELIRCTIDNNRADDHGGGLFIDLASALSMTDCDITNNAVYNGNGGGIYARGTLELDSCNIDKNSAKYSGGGIYYIDSVNTLSMTNCNITNNLSSYGYGGGIYAYGTLELDSCTIDDNLVNKDGGGIYLIDPLSSTAMTNCNITNNSSNYGSGGGVFSTGPLSMIDCNISNNNSASSKDGGGVFSADTLELLRCIINGNTAGQSGGGLYIDAENTLSMTDCNITNNRASNENGGGIFSAGTLEMLGCTIDGNTAIYNGGGLFYSGNLTMLNCTISNNYLYNVSSEGGGLYVGSGTAMISFSTFSGNSCRCFGGGIHLKNGSYNIENSTIYDNYAYTSGSGICVDNSSLTLNGCTIFDNEGDYYYACSAIYIQENCGEINIKNSIFSKNVRNCDSDICNSGFSTTVSNCLIGVNYSYRAYTEINNIYSTDPKLLSPALNDNPNNTHTLAINRHSLARNAANAATALSTDQRGFARNGTPDMGAYEWQDIAAPTVQSSNFSVNNIMDSQVDLSWICGNGEKRIILAKLGSEVDADPMDGYAYTADTSFGSGSQIGSENYVVGNTDSSSITVAGLNSENIYYFKVFDYNNVDDPSYLFPALTSSEVALPITLQSFLAEAQNGSVLLKWITASETENLGYILEKNTDEEQDWERVMDYMSDTTLAGHGTTTQSNTYEYSDKNVRPGCTYQYRLADVDYHNTITWHDAVEITMDGEVNLIPEEFGLQTAYPNPFNPTLTIRYGLTEEAQTIVKILNLKGQTIATLSDKHQKAGLYELQWQAGNNASGVYLVEVVSGEKTDLMKVLLTK
jgi:hypothetical protein